jgi:hypothetical protein
VWSLASLTKDLPVKNVLFALFSSLERNDPKDLGKLNEPAKRILENSRSKEAKWPRPLTEGAAFDAMITWIEAAIVSNRKAVVGPVALFHINWWIVEQQKGSEVSEATFRAVVKDEYRRLQGASFDAERLARRSLKAAGVQGSTVTRLFDARKKRLDPKRQAKKKGRKK